MKIERTRNAGRNVIFGGMLKLYQTIVPFLMRTVMIHFMGVPYLGLNSLFASVLQVLNLAELGVGSAMVYSMYKPIIEDDYAAICGLMRLYRLYYRIIGGVIAAIGVLLLPMIPRLVHGDIPAGMNLSILYLLNLGATVLSYWLFAYKNCLLQAHQRNDIASKITLIVNTMQYGLQLMVLMVFRNYYLYLMVMLLSQAVSNLVTARVVTKMFPEYAPRGKLDQAAVTEISHRIRDLFTSKIGAVIVNSADTIVISSFLGLTVLAVYQNYYFILTSVIGFVAILFHACMAGIGNSILVESKEKNFKDLKRLTFLTCWIGGVCAACLLCLYQPFMELWVGNSFMLEFDAVICFCVYYFVYEINQLLNTYKDAAGIWHKDRFRPLVTALTNLGMNLVMVRYWGIYGVLLSTVLSMVFIGMPWLLYNLFTTVFEKEQLCSYLRGLLRYTVFAFGVCVVTYSLCRLIHLSQWGTFFVRGIICCLVPNGLLFMAYRRRTEWKESIDLLNRLTKRKRKEPLYGK